MSQRYTFSHLFFMNSYVKGGFFWFKAISFDTLKFPWQPSRAYSSTKSSEIVFCMPRGFLSMTGAPFYVPSNGYSEVVYVISLITNHQEFIFLSYMIIRNKTYSSSSKICPRSKSCLVSFYYRQSGSQQTINFVFIQENSRLESRHLKPQKLKCAIPLSLDFCVKAYKKEVQRSKFGNGRRSIFGIAFVNFLQN